MYGSVNGDNSIGTTVGNRGGSVAVSIDRSPPLTLNTANGRSGQAAGNSNRQSRSRLRGNSRGIGNGKGIGNNNGNLNGNGGGIGNGNLNGNNNGLSH